MLLQLAVTFLTNSSALTTDEAMWQYIGRNWFRYNLIPYAGGVDNKSPLFFAIFGLSDKLFGVNFWFPRLLGIIAQSTGLYFTYKIANRISDKQTGFIAISLYGLSMLWHSTGGKYASYTESYSITLIIISFYFYFNATKYKDYFISGVVAGLGFGFRYSAFFGLIAIFITLLRKNTISALYFFIGVSTSVVLLTFLGYMAGINLHDFIFYSLIDNFGKGSSTDYSLLWRAEQFFNGFFYSELILFYPALIGYILIKKRIDTLTTWLICEFVGLNVIGIYEASHFKNLLPALSIISALLITFLIKKNKISFKHSMLIIWLTFFPKLLEPLVTLKNLLFSKKEKTELSQENDGTIKKKLGQWVKSNTTQKDLVFIAGYGAQVQAYSERLSPSIYFNVTQTQTAKKRFYYEIVLHKPSMILVPQSANYNKFVDYDIRHFLDLLIAENYYLDQNLFGYNVYRIRIV